MLDYFTAHMTSTEPLGQAVNGAWRQNFWAAAAGDSGDTQLPAPLRGFSTCSRNLMS